MKKNILILVLSLTTYFSCKTPTTEVPSPTETDSLLLNIKEIELKTAVLSFHWVGLQSPVSIVLQRNNKPIKTLKIYSQDTLLIDRDLNPSTNYNWQVIAEQPDQIILKSNLLNERTVDSTSHNFMWSIDTIGYKATHLNGGIIINENDMWVGGDIYPDSTSYWNTIHYGLAHWNGIKWSPEIVTARWFYENSEIKGPVEVRDMALIENEKLYITTGLELLKKEGNIWVEKALDIMDTKGFEKIWAIDENNIFIYGSNGGLSFCNGSSLTLIPTNTNLNIADVHGDYNQNTKEYELLALASTQSDFGNQLFKISGNSVSLLSTEGLDDYSKRTIWFTNGRNYFISGDRVYFKEKISDPYWKISSDFPASNWYTVNINGWGQNDYFILNADGHLLHFNGSTWKDFKQELNLVNITVYRIILKNDLILILGEFDDSINKGIIIRGKRLR